MHTPAVHVVVLTLALGLLTPARAQQPPLSLSLAEAQERAVQGNRMLRAAAAEVRRATAGRLRSRSGYLPSIRLSEGVTRSDDAVNAFGTKLKQERFTQADFSLGRLNAPDPITNYQTRVEVGQPLFSGGEALYGRRRASAGLRAAEAERAHRVQEVRLHTAEAYWGLVVARAALTTVRQALETARRHLAVTQAHYDQEMIPLSDLLAAQVRVAALRTEEIEDANKVAEAEDALSLVMGMPAETTIVPADTLSSRPAAPSLPELVARALRRRPDLTAAAHRVQAARSGVGLARAAYLPHIDGLFQFELDSNEFFNQRGESWTAGLMLRWNLFSGFRALGGVQEAQARAAAAEERVAYLRARVEREVRKAYRDLTAAFSQLGVAEEAVAQADERLRISELQYRENQITAVDLLAADTSRQEARLRRLRALYALNVNKARLAYTVGGDENEGH